MVHVKNLWKYRKKIGEAAVNHGEFKDLDIVVPRSKINLVYDKINEVCTKVGLRYVIVGHVGDGNFHVNIFNNKVNAFQLSYST